MTTGAFEFEGEVVFQRGLQSYSPISQRVVTSNLLHNVIREEKHFERQCKGEMEDADECRYENTRCFGVGCRRCKHGIDIRDEEIAR